MTKTLPQLAVDIAPDCSNARFPLWGFPKVDGVRGCHVTGKFTGRSLEDMKNTALVEKFSHVDYEGFDGELTIDGHLTNRDLPAALRVEGNETLCSLTTGITNRAKLRKGETALPTNVVWNLFDCLHPDVIDLTYEERYAALERRAAPLLYVRVLPYEVIENPEQAQAFIDKCILLGLEGAIFRDPKAKHKHGRATAKLNDFWRFKPTSDKDFIITGFEEAMENQNEATVNALGRTERSSHKENKVGKGTLGKFLGTDCETGQAIIVPAGCLTHAQRQHVWDNQSEYLGRGGKYISLDTGVKSAPRQARFLCFRADSDIIK